MHAIDPEEWSQEMEDNPNPTEFISPEYVLPVDARTPLPNGIETAIRLKNYFIACTYGSIDQFSSIYDATEVRALMDELKTVCRRLYEKIEQITADNMKDQNFIRDLHERKMDFFRVLLTRFRVNNEDIWREIKHIRNFVNLYIIERTKRCNRVPTHFRFVSTNTDRLSYGF
jgi:hypothetical protein